MACGVTPAAQGSTARAGLQPLTPEEAAKLGRLHGCCVICGRTLTDPTSVNAGIGPVCGRKVSASYDELTA